MEEDNLNTTETHMQLGAKIQRFYDILREHCDHLQEWIPDPEDEHEASLKRVREDLVYDLLDRYSDIFDKILT